MVLFASMHLTYAQSVCVEHVSNAFPVTNPQEKDGYDLVWNDEFTSVAETRENYKFRYQPSREKIFIAGEENFSIVDGNGYLDLVELDEPKEYKFSCGYVGGDWHEFCTDTYEFTTTSLRSKEAFLEGFFEIRCKLPLGQGLNTAFWLHAWDKEYGTDGLYNEIDFFEELSTYYEAREFGFNIHVDDKGYVADPNLGIGAGLHEYLGKFSSCHQSYRAKKDLSEEFNTFGCAWGDDYLKLYLNNKLIREVRSSNSAEIKSMIDKLKLGMNIIVGIGFTGKAQYPYNFKTKDSYVIDYIRVYKKKPEVTYAQKIIYQGKKCVKISAEAEAENTFEVKADNGKVIKTDFNTKRITAYVEIFDITKPVDIVIRATDTENHSSSVEYSFLDNLNSAFEIDDYNCQRDDISLACHATSNYAYQTHNWDIYECDENGNITNSNPLNNTLISGKTVNFSGIGLENGQHYSVKHTVKKISNTSVKKSEYKVVKIELTKFTYDIPTCQDNDMKMEVRALYENPYNMFILYESNEKKEWVKRIEDKGGMTCTFENLEPGKYYLVFQGTSGGCVGKWTISGEHIYVPSMPQNTEFNTTITTSGTKVSASCRAVDNSNSSSYMLFESDKDGSLINKVSPDQYGHNVTFGYDYGMVKNKYYLIAHGKWGSCSAWTWSGTLIYVNGLKSSAEIVKENIDLSQVMKSYSAEKNSLDTDNMIVFPNPSNGSFNISLNEKIDNGKIAVYNTQGDKILYNTISNCSKTTLDLSSYPQGLYFINIISEGKRYTHKVILKK